MADWDEPQNPTATERADAKAYQGRIADLERQIAELRAGGTRKAAECERLKRERLHAGKLQSQYAGRLRRAIDQANALGTALDIERARALAAEARADNKLRQFVKETTGRA